ncbi:TPA: Opacity protein opA54, partial [Neisseria gonorrhoeae]
WNNSKYSVSIKELERRKNSTSGGGSQLNIKHRKTEHQENGTFHAVSSLGLSTVYDFRVNDKFKPYIGVRVGYGHVRHSISTKKTTEFLTTAGSPGVVPGTYKVSTTPGAHQESNSIRRVGLGVIAGVGFDITP